MLRSLQLWLVPTVQLHRSLHPSLPCSRLLSFRADNTDGPTEEQQIAARDFLAGFGPDSIPKRLYEITFSRSSGPGGQNVNK